MCFDGKESETLVYLNGKNQKVKQETYTLLAYPGEHSLGFVSLDDKSGRGVAATLINYLESKMIDYTRIRVLGSDGTNTLTGYNVGKIKVSIDCETQIGGSTTVLSQKKLLISFFRTEL